MKKMYPVVSNKYIVDEEGTILEGDYLWSPELNTVVGPTKDRHIWIENGPKVIGIVGEANRIGNLPVIEFEEKSLYNQGKELHEKLYRYKGANPTVLNQHSYATGYAANSKGCWTDEDMRKVWLLAIENTILKRHQEPVDITYEQLLESLRQPNITEVELEVEERPAVHLTEGSRRCNNLPPTIGLKITKVTDKGTVIIIQKP